MEDKTPHFDRSISSSSKLSSREAFIEIVVTFVVLLFPSVVRTFLSQGFAYHPIDLRQYASIVISGTIAMVLIWFILHKDGEGFWDIGLRFDKFTSEFFTGLGVLFLILFSLSTLAIILSLVFNASELTKISEQNKKLATMFSGINPFLIPPLCIFVGIYEELWFRGFLITRLSRIYQDKWFLVIVSSFLFAIAHLYQSWFNVVIIFFLGIVFGHLFLSRRSLISPIVVHTGFDIVSMFAAKYIVKMG